MTLIRTYFWIVLLSLTPLIEQRGAIPWGIFGEKLPPLTVFLVSYIASLLPVPIILLFFNAVFGLMKKYRWLDWFTGFIERKIRRKSARFEKYEEVALILFIGIPLPTTGIWTGSMIAAALGFDIRKTLLCAALGGLLSAVAITLACTAFPGVAGLLGLT